MILVWTSWSLVLQAEVVKEAIREVRALYVLLCEKQKEAFYRLFTRQTRLGLRNCKHLLTSGLTANLAGGYQLETSELAVLGLGSHYAWIWERGTAWTERVAKGEYPASQQLH